MSPIELSSGILLEHRVPSPTRKGKSLKTDTHANPRGKRITRLKGLEATAALIKIHVGTVLFTEIQPISGHLLATHGGSSEDPRGAR